MAKLNVTLCGSFRRDLVNLETIFNDLSGDFNLLSPRGVSFVDSTVEFVKLDDELELSVDEIETKHLAAITNSDFVWLHAPDGYVGLSAAAEIGFARAYGIPVYSDIVVADQTLATFVHVVTDPYVVAKELAPNAGAGVNALQVYYQRICERRDWNDESASEILLLMVEEFGELARAIRKSLKLRRDHEYTNTEVEAELADVQLYLVHLASSLGVDLAQAVTAKEQLNQTRFDEHS